MFIVDMGLELYQYNGKNANKDERFRATQYVTMLKSERMGKAKVDVVDEGDVDETHVIFTTLKDGVSKRTTMKRKAPPPPTALKGMYQIR